MTSIPNPTKVKVQIGSRRRDRRVDGRINNSFNTNTDPETGKTDGRAPLTADGDSKTCLADLCSYSFLRSKRKTANNGQSELNSRKVVKLDSKDSSKVVTRRASSTAEPTSLYTGKQAFAGGAPQVEIVNGKIVLKESSLLVVNQDAASAEAEYEEVEEGVHATCRYSSFSKKIGGKSWSIDETKEFYKALQQCGTDFSVMEAIFPHRSRKELKLKFFREESQHPELVKIALDSVEPLDMERVLIQDEP